MVGFVHDQAEGLRRLLRPDFVRVLSLASGRSGVGKTTLLCNLAAVIAQRGRRVLIVSEQKRLAPPDLTPPPAHDLLAVLQGRRCLDQIVAESEAGIGWLALGDALSHLPALSAPAQESLAKAFGQLAQSWDVVLLDPLPGTRASSLSLHLTAQALLVVTSPEAASVTATYALMKRLSQHFAQRHFHVVVSKGGTGAKAGAIYNNLQATASRYLAVRLECLGHIPADPRVRQAARLGRTPARAFPDSPATVATRLLADAIDSWPWPDAEMGRLDAFLNRLVMTSRLTAENAHL